MNQPISDEQILQNVGAQAHSTSCIPTPEGRSEKPSHWTLPGFSGKSKVLTSFGQLPIEALRRNDPLKTSSGTFLKVSWVDRIHLDHDFLSSHPHAQPILFPAGSLGHLKPLANTLVSPAQKILTSTPVGNSSFKPASALVGRGRISKKPQAAFTYFLFGCESACSVCIDGIWCSVLPHQTNEH
jgi:hypothetical protein